MLPCSLASDHQTQGSAEKESTYITCVSYFSLAGMDGGNLWGRKGLFSLQLRQNKIPLCWGGMAATDRCVGLIRKLSSHPQPQTQNRE